MEAQWITDMLAESRAQRAESWRKFREADTEPLKCTCAKCTKEQQSE